MRDPYTVLGVPKSASEAEVKKAFRRLAKEHHPDRNANDPKGQGAFSELNSAYEIVGDPNKRAQFDRGEIGPMASRNSRVSTASAAGARRGGFEPAAAIRSRPRRLQPFRCLRRPVRRCDARGGGSAGTRAHPKGQDIEATLTVTLADIANRRHQAPEAADRPRGRGRRAQAASSMARSSVSRGSAIPAPLRVSPAMCC
jgi:DnaJ-class molecular chaperone